MNICKEFVNSLYDEIKNKSYNITPKLVVVQVGDDTASTIYINCKRRACDKLNFLFEHVKLKETIAEDELIDRLDKINKDKSVTGCIVQLPLPKHIDSYNILNYIDPKKDVDCFHYENIGKLCLGKPNFIPATPFGIYKFIKYLNIETKGKCCVILGKSDIVGKPLQILLSDENDLALTTILCDKYTKNVSDYTRLADILVVATGVHHLINNPEWIKQDAVIIDVGIHRVIRDNKKKLEGDVDYELLKDKCSVITPVPGGIGPMTVASLMYNLSNVINI